MQEALLTAWTKRDQYEGRGSYIGYLRQTAFRLFLNQVVRQRRRKRLAEEHGPVDVSATVPQEAIDEEDARDRLVALVRESVESLPEEQREAFLLFRFQGLSTAEVAAAASVPLKTAETRIRRATLRVAELLAPHRHLLR